MTKGYWIAHIDVHDLDAYRSYIDASSRAVAAHGGRFLVRGGAAEPVEGDLRTRHAVIEFPSYVAALAAYRSPEYQAAQRIRAAVSSADVVVVEAVSG